MNTLEAIKTRRSIRKFKNKSVPKSELAKIIEAGIRAPSSMNKQPWKFVVVTNPEKIKKMVDVAKTELITFLKTPEGKKKYPGAVERFMQRAQKPDDMIFYNAPAVIFVIQTEEAANGQFDHGLATENILLSAHELGLGTVCVGLAVFMENSESARKMLGMKKGEKIVITIPIGYPDETPEEHERDFDVVDWIE